MATQGSESETFRKYLESDWRQWLSEYPELATSFGFPGFDDRWTDDSADGIERRVHHLSESAATLRRIDPTRLSASERTSYGLYQKLLDDAHSGLEFGFDPLPFQLGMPHNLRIPINQMEGVHLTASETLEIQPRTRVSEYESTLERLRRFSAAVDQNIELLREGLRQGFTPHRVAVRGVPDQIRGLAPADPLASPLLHAFIEFPDRVGADDRKRLVNEAKEAYAGSVAPALERLHEFLVSRYLPACRESPGVSVLPNGSALYDYLVRCETTTDLTAKQIHEMGLAEVRRIRSAMEALKTRSGFPGSFPEFLEFLRTDARFFAASAEALVDGYRVIAKKADPGLPQLFGKLPRLPYGVLPVPDFRARSSPGAYYMPGAPATGRPGTFFANTYDLNARPRWEMESLCLHEAVPGHHLQISLAQEMEDLPDFRRYTGPTAFVEGWGLYAESLGEELGFYRDPYSKMGQLTFDMWRSIRLVVDTGIHAMGWTREQAIQFFRENTGKSEVDIAVEVDRYIVWPGQALAYKMGQLKIREMRTSAEAKLGDRFDPRTFHDLVLEEGAIPLGELDSRVRAWLATEAHRASRDSASPPKTGAAE